MNLLVLVDLENILARFDRDPALLDPTAGDDLRPLLADDRRATVVVACNDESVRLRNVTVSNIHETSGRIARYLNARLELDRLEFALVRQVPQAADVALWRLMKQSPRTSREVFDRIALVSMDEGLSGAVGDYLRLRPRVRGPYRVWPVHHERRPTPACPPVAVSAMAPRAKWSARVQSPATVAWASQQRVEMPAARTLVGLATRVAEQPGILSQVSLTRASVRGVARDVWRYADGGDVPPLGWFSESDGVELALGHRSPSGHVVRSEDSSVGEGAVWVALQDGATGSASTRLPSALVRSLSEHAAVARGRLRDRECLARPWSGASCRVRFRNRGRTFVCEVAREPAAVPSAWWWTGSKARSEQRFEHWFERGQTLSAVVSARPISRAGELVFQADLTPGAALRLAEPLGGGQLGIAETHGGQRAVILASRALAPHRPLTEWRHAHETGPPEWRALRAALGRMEQDVRRLATLPLVVL